MKVIYFVVFRLVFNRTLSIYGWSLIYHLIQDSESPKFSYVGVALTKDHAIVWISHMKNLLGLCLEQLSISGSKLDAVSGGASSKKVSSWLSFLIAFTSIKV